MVESCQGVQFMEHNTVNKKRLLIVVDMQNDFISGTLGSSDAKKAVPAVKELIQAERQAGANVIFTQDTHGENYLSTQEGKLLPVPHCIRRTAGWNVPAELFSAAPDARIFEKDTFGSISLAEHVRREQYDEITLCGVCTDICVISNALLLKAYCPESRVRVVSSACAGTSTEAHAAALRTMQSCQIIIE